MLNTNDLRFLREIRPCLRETEAFLCAKKAIGVFTPYVSLIHSVRKEIFTPYVSLIYSVHKGRLLRI